MNLIKGTKCECADSKCPEHSGLSRCHNNAMSILYRTDMQDEAGTAMCDECSDDAFAAGLFSPGCMQCGANTDDGEGYDGLCGNCADKAEGD